MLKPLATAIPEFEANIRQRLDRPGEPLGLPTGYKVLDRLGGAVPGQLGIVAGRPGMGKSALAECIAFKVARECMIWNRTNPEAKPRAVAFYSLEQTKQVMLERHALRLVSGDAGITASGYRSGELSQEQYETLIEMVKRVESYPILVNDDPETTVREIREELRLARQQYDLRFVTLDFLQRMKEIQQVGDSAGRFQKVGDIAENLADIAKGTGEEPPIPFWLLSQLKAPTDKRPADDRPILTDLYGSRQLEAAARFALFLYRTDYYTATIPGTVPNGEVDLMVVKNNNGPLGTFKMRFDASRTAFLNAEEG